MPVVRYTTINGEIVAEKRNGVRSLYVPDALGSTVALLDNTQTKTDTFASWPYGETVHLTGTNPTPFTFVGTQGYHSDNASRTYVRARVLEPPKARWLTEDPIGFSGGDANLYRYVRNMPSLRTDESGLNPMCIGAAICAGAAIISILIACRNDPKGYAHCIACYCARNPLLCVAVEATCAVFIVGCIGVVLPVPIPAPQDPVPQPTCGWFPKPGHGRRPRLRQQSGPCDPIEEIPCAKLCQEQRCASYECRKEYGCQCIDCPPKGC